jgi:hypothetical protein
MSAKCAIGGRTGSAETDCVSIVQNFDELARFHEIYALLKATCNKQQEKSKTQPETEISGWQKNQEYM